jgi:hypothetical protein
MRDAVHPCARIASQRGSRQIPLGIQNLSLFALLGKLFQFKW